MLSTLAEALRTELTAIRQEIQKQTAANHNAYEAAKKKWGEIPEIISSSILGTKVDKAATDTHRKNQEDQQGELIRWARAAFFAAAAYGAVAFWQGCTFRRQLEQMTTATEASTNAVRLAQDSLEISSENFDRQMRQMVYQTAAEIKAANAAKKAAEITAQALADSRREAIIENGAVLSITDLGFPKPVANSQFVKWEWAFENYGRTPAVDVTVQQELYVGTSSHTCWRLGGGQPRATPTVEFPAPIFREQPKTGSCLILTEAWGRFGLVRYEQLLPVKGSIKLHLNFRYSDAYGTYTGLICLENAGHADGDITPHAVLCDVPRWTKELPRHGDADKNPQ